MNSLSVRWQKVIIWLTGYLNVIAFVVAGGYLFLKTEREDVKASAKVALAAVAVFSAIDILIAFIRHFLNLTGAATGWLVTVATVFAIVEIIAFVGLFVIDMVMGFERACKYVRGDERKSENETKE
ncbi:MAG: hypothetical protein ACI4U2_04875 [Christensenellaceae bacterium]